MKKPEVSKHQMAKVHPAIPEAYEQLRQGRISRREFLQFFYGWLQHKQRGYIRW